MTPWPEDIFDGDAPSVYQTEWVAYDPEDVLIECSTNSGWRELTSDEVSVAGYGSPSGLTITLTDWMPGRQIRVRRVSTPIARQVLFAADASEVRAALREPVSIYTGDPTSAIARPDLYTLYICIFAGQSLAEAMMDIAYPAETAIVASAPVYPDHALMLSTGVRQRTRLGVDDQPAPPAPTGATLVPLIEAADNPNNVYETAASAAINHTIRDVEAATGGRPKMAALVCARAAWSLAQLSRGQGAYAWMMRGIDDIARAARAMGLRPVVVHLDWCQTETDGFIRTPPALYSAGFAKYLRNARADIAAITDQTEQIMVTLAPSQFAASDGYNNVLEAHRLITAGDLNVVSCGATYALPRSTGQQVHPASIGQNRRGTAISRAIVGGVFGWGYAPMAIERVWMSGASEVTIRWSDVPRIDETQADITTSGLPAGNLAGLAVHDGTGNAPAITATTITGRDMRLTLSGAPAAPALLMYAQQANADGQYGPVAGARGWIRRAGAGVTSIYEGRPVHDWAIPAIVRIER